MSTLTLHILIPFGILLVNMGNVTISATKKEDIPYIEEKLKKYVLDSADIDWQQFFIAKEADKPLAFGRIIDRGGCFEIASLGVDYYHRKKGIGKKMLFFLIDEAKKRDKDRPIYIVTHIPDFFAKYGFEEVNIYPDYFGHKKKKCHWDESKIRVMEYKK